MAVDYLVLSQSTRLTDGRTDGRTDRNATAIPCVRIRSRTVKMILLTTATLAQLRRTINGAVGLLVSRLVQSSSLDLQYAPLVTYCRRRAWRFRNIAICIVWWNLQKFSHTISVVSRFIWSKYQYSIFVPENWNWFTWRWKPIKDALARRFGHNARGDVL